mmetsp:Transcript_26720/g.52458  ORF Transcript_26720/g.52458 Transcript_26720/m.52458 type:complete len:140 (-) Transcript_26720:245-664(-)
MTAKEEPTPFERRRKEGEKERKSAASLFKQARCRLRQRLFLFELHMLDVIDPDVRFKERRTERGIERGGERERERAICVGAVGREKNRNKCTHIHSRRFIHVNEQTSALDPTRSFSLFLSRALPPPLRLPFPPFLCMCA